MEELVERYIMLRDKKAEMTSAFKAKVENLDGMLKKIEGALLVEFNAQKLESVRTKSGTAYKSLKTSATVADWDATLDFVKENGLWQMLEHRVSKSAVEEYKEANNDLPPGLNWREEITINVRRS